MNDRIQCDVYDRRTGTQNWAYTMYNIVRNFVNFRSEHVAVIVYYSDIITQISLYYNIRLSFDQT
jgi:hypothetical protein